MNRTEVCTFLQFSYLPSREWPSAARALYREYLEGIRPSPTDVTEEGLIERGVEIWKSVFSGASRGRCVVPLSGGLDSRAILGGLVDEVGRDHVVSISFGVEGSLDFELARRVARAAGVRFVGLDLAEVALERESLLSLAETTSPCWLFDTFYSRRMYEQFPDDSIWWSGYMGDSLAGSRLTMEKSRTWAEAARRFAWTFRSVKSMTLPPSDFDSSAVLPEGPLGEDPRLSLDEQLNFFLRQPQVHRPLLTSHRGETRRPFEEKAWRDFILGVPWHLRVGKVLYKKILARAFPGLMRLPHKDSYGAPAYANARRIERRRRISRLPARARQAFGVRSASVNRRANYIDFNHALRTRDDVQTLVRDALASLKRRDVIDWLDLEDLWRSHLDCRADVADALMLLTALDLHLEAADRRAEP